MLKRLTAGPVLLALLLVCVPALIGRPAEAEEGTPTTGAPFDKASYAQEAQAKAHYKLGVQAREKGEHEKALEAFRKSYGAVKSPNSRLLIVKSLSDSGRHRDAYLEALALADEADAAAKAQPDKYKKTAEEARAVLADTKASVAFVTVTVSGVAEGGVLAVNGVVVNETEWGKPVLVEPGDVEVVLTSAKGEWKKTVQAKPGGNIDVTISPEASKPAPQPTPEEPVVESSYDGPDRLMLAVIAGGVGGLGLLTFGIFGALTVAHYDELESDCGSRRHCDPALRDEADAGRAFQVVANVGLVVTIVGAGACGGLLLWHFLDQDGEDTTTAQLSIGAGSAFVTGSFQ